MRLHGIIKITMHSFSSKDIGVHSNTMKMALIWTVLKSLIMAFTLSFQHFQMFQRARLFTLLIAIVGLLEITSLAMKCSLDKWTGLVYAHLPWWLNIPILLKSIEAEISFSTSCFKCNQYLMWWVRLDHKFCIWTEEYHDLKLQLESLILMIITFNIPQMNGSMMLSLQWQIGDLLKQ